ncbi:MAG: RNA polymerase sigma factor [Myxococcota bacterium]|nr:RNA polymerase sigma factor [Myxococcota bacterium]
MTQSTEDQLSSFVQTHRADAIRFAWGLLGTEGHMAEDMAQRAFAKAWQRRGSFRGTSQVKTWLFRIIVNEVRSYQRWRAVRSRAVFFLQWKDSLQVNAPPSGDVGLRHRLEAALGTLSAQQREAFILVQIHGHSVKEASGLLRRSEGTIKTHLHRARRKLKDQLADLWVEV